MAVVTKISVRDMIAKLGEYNPDADFQVVVNNYPQPFEVCFGGSDGCTKAKCDDVSLMVDCENEKG